MTVKADIDIGGLRQWLMKRPRPDALRLTFQDGDVKLLPRADQPWQELAETVVALEPTLVECCDKEKTVIRAIKGADLGKFERERDNSRVQPPAPLHSDPETARMCYVADLVHRAYQHATDVAFEKVAGAYDTAFARLIDLTERIDARADNMERRLERAEALYRREANERLQEAIERAEEEGGAEGFGGLVKSFLGGMEMGSSAPTNGKGSAS